MLAPDLDDINSLEEAAAYLKLTERKVAELARLRRLGAIKEGRRWLFPRAAVLEYVERNTRAVVTPGPRARPMRGRTFP
ncbi:helix-turn-helix domain-containing protein [Leifsonia sp. LS-T14]|uniref:helix-turn-helix domain-containing protein n=1 Tax=unclassified Leifsonia TaxID=2663824 RepID=UPI0035A5C2C0